MNHTHEAVVGKAIKKIDFDGAHGMAHSKARNKRFRKSAHLFTTNVFKSSYGAFFVTLLANPEDFENSERAYLSAKLTDLKDL
jgi:hypothetical protein